MRLVVNRQCERRDSARRNLNAQRLRVFMMDLLSIVPYYDGHLCAALAKEDGVDVVLGAITYPLDRGYFHRQCVRNRPGIDVTAKLPFPLALLRCFKAVEASLNLAVLAVRLLISRLDVLHVQFLPLMERGIPFERWVLREARWLGVRVVHTVHNVLPPPTCNSPTPDVHRIRYRAAYESADSLICHDERAKALLVHEFGLPPERIRVIPHGPLFEEGCSQTREEARLRLRIGPDECLVLWQGILEPYKGVSFLLKAWREIGTGAKPARLAIVGSGREEIKRSIRNEVDALGIGSSVRLELRFVSVDELSCWYQASDVLVYPYSESTTSGALMTGINYAKAMIATTLPGFQQILRHGENALLVDYGDVNGLASALKRLIADGPLRRLLVERIRLARDASPGWAAIASQTREAYETVVAGEKRGARRPLWFPT